MIGALTGKITQKRLDNMLLMVQDVGFEVYVPANLLTKTKIGQTLSIYTHTHIRQDELKLYGFISGEELNLFRLLLTVPGIGGKTALAVVDRGVEVVQQAVINADVSFFTTIPRLGKKNAQKIIIELKVKLGSLTEVDLSDEGSETNEIINVLAQMGFSRPEINQALRQIPPTTKTTEDKIKSCLKWLSKY